MFRRVWEIKRYMCVQQDAYLVIKIHSQSRTGESLLDQFSQPLGLLESAIEFCFAFS